VSAICPTCGHAPAPAQQPLTTKQSMVLDVVRIAIARSGVAPTLSEIADAVGLRSMASVHQHLETLEAKGYIRREFRKPQAITLVPAAPVAAMPPYTPHSVALADERERDAQPARLSGGAH
jgi:SOS-response transcriptional repressor LexA